MPDTAEWGWVTHWTDLLDQDEVWRDANGTILRLDDIEPDYCGRVRAFALRQAEDVYHLIGMQACAGTSDMSEQASIDFDRAFDVFLDAGEDPKAWLEQAPLLIALKYRSEGLPARPTVCHCGYPFHDDGGESWDHSACYPGTSSTDRRRLSPWPVTSRKPSPDRSPASAGVYGAAAAAGR
ncbi:hypothetical protein [Streptomyces sp. AD55]|uniref:hypothetical protein n=1 Tax=Streptomyces sp. AD55 TaxID=3242895 RepID=UPI0035287783